VELWESCKPGGWDILDGDGNSASSRSKEKRPQLDQLLADFRTRRIGVVWVYRYDRFARSLR
jgi:DNA invertase Pin-like site-specific DNA recombinase